MDDEPRIDPDVYTFIVSGNENFEISQKPDDLLKTITRVSEAKLSKNSKERILTAFQSRSQEELRTLSLLFIATRAGTQNSQLQAEALGILVSELGKIVSGKNTSNEKDLDKQELKILHDSVSDLTKVATALKNIADKKQQKYDELEKQHEELMKKLSRSKMIIILTAGNALVALAASNLLNYFLAH